MAASEDATAAGSTAEGAAEAQRAQSWAPWSHRPHQLLGEARLARREDDAARTSLRRALALDRRDWSIWYDLALVEEGAARERALSEALRLNPLSPELAELLTDS
jgi:Flp pilus assembly protein TadD